MIAFLGMAYVFIFQKHLQKWKKTSIEICAESMMLSTFLCTTDLCKTLNDLPEKGLI